MARTGPQVRFLLLFIVPKPSHAITLRENRHVALKLLSAYATRAHEVGQLHDELAVLARIASAAPAHAGYAHVNRLLHQFAFDSHAGHHTCFVLGVTACDVAALQDRQRDRRLPLRSILRLTHDVLQGLRYLHDECGIVHCGECHGYQLCFSALTELTQM